MNQPTTRVGIVGIGRIARLAHVPALLTMEGVQISAICDVDQQAIAEFARTYGITETYFDATELAAQSNCDCVFVLTRPHDEHASISLEMPQHGKDVVCEKPMAMNLDDAAAARRCRERNVPYPDDWIQPAIHAAGPTGEIPLRRPLRGGL